MSQVQQFKPNRQIAGAPRDLEAEQGLLGAIMFTNTLMDQLADELDPEMFYEGTHSRIFVAMRDLIGAGRSADPVTVLHALGTDPGLDQLGGADYLMLLVDKAPGQKLGLEYAGIVREMWRRKKLIQLGDSLAAGGRDGQTADEMITLAESDMAAAEIHARGISLVSASEAVDIVIGQYDDPNKAAGLSLGLQPIDDVIGGMMPGEAWLVAARPSMGKSGLASTASLNVSVRGHAPSGERWGVIEICSEMTVAQMMRRHIADFCFEMFGPDGPTYSAMRRRALTESQQRMMREAAKRLRDLDTLKCLYRTGLTIRAIRALARRQKAVWARKGIRLGLVVIDHVGLVVGSSQTRGRTEEQGEVARDTKSLAGDLDCAVMGLVQLSRRVEERDNKRPRLDDLRDSGEWEQSADGVIGLYRDAYYAVREPEPKRRDDKILWDERCSSPMVDALLLKVREGEVQTVKLWADMGRNAIRGYAPESLFARSYPNNLERLLDPDEPLDDAARLFE